MFELFKKIWRDPVWSKVISVGILGALGLIWSARHKLPDWVDALRQFLLVPVPLWIVGCTVVLASVAVLFLKRRPSTEALTPATARAAASLAIHVRLRVSIEFPRPEKDPTRIALVIQNTGGTDVLHLHINDVHIFQKTARFLKDIPSIPAGKNSNELEPVIIEYPDSMAHDMPGAMYEASQAGANIRNNDAFDYQGEAIFYDAQGNQFRALWRYTFYPKKYFVIKNPPLSKYPDPEKIDLGPFLVVSDVGIEPIAAPRHPKLDHLGSGNGAAQGNASVLRSTRHTVPLADEGDEELTISSPNDFVINVTRDQGTAKGLIITPYNHRLDPISQVFVTVRTAQSFDSRHDKFRNSSDFNATRIDMLDVIQPSSKGRSTWLIRKEPDKPHLFIGNDFSHEMIWPEMDKSMTQKWLLTVGIRAQTAPRNSTEKANVFSETMHHVVVMWDKNANEFSVRKAEVQEVVANAKPN